MAPWLAVAFPLVVDILGASMNSAE